MLNKAYKAAMKPTPENTKKLSNAMKAKFGLSAQEFLKTNTGEKLIQR